MHHEHVTEADGGKTGLFSVYAQLLIYFTNYAQVSRPFNLAAGNSHNPAIGLFLVASAKSGRHYLPAQLLNYRSGRGLSS